MVSYVFRVGYLSLLLTFSTMGLCQSTPERALVNLSVNARVTAAGITPGFVVQAGGGRFVILGEAQYHTGEPLPDPQILVRRLSDAQVLAQNDNWQTHPSAVEVEARVRRPAGALDAALALTLPAGAYVVDLRDRLGRSGQALVSIQQVEQSFGFSTELSGVACADLDQRDGAVAAQPYPYVGWRCHDTLVSADDPTALRVRLRWNRPDKPSTATLIWLAGEDGRRAHGDFERGLQGATDDRSLRTRLAEDAGIRSIEVQFLDHPLGQTVLAEAPGFWGYWSAPQQGYPRVAKAYLDALAFLRLPGVNLLRGDWTTLVGSSNGATVIAFALAYLGAERSADRAVFFSGPFLVDVAEECRNPGFPAYMGRNDAVPGRISGDSIRALISAWNGWPDCQVAGPEFSGRSLLDAGARRDFPSLDIAVVLGAEDAYGPWLLNSNRLWFEAIQARRESRQVIPGVPHEVWGVNVLSEAALYEVLQRSPES